MVMGDTSFTTVTGEEISRTNIIQNMIDFYNEKYPNAFITDFNEGSVIRNILESFAVEEYHILRVDNDINKVAFISTAIGNYLDLHGKDMNAPRSNGKQAWGTVTFSIPQTETYEIVIPYNTILVSSETGLQFTTINDAYIPVGETSVEVAVRSVVVGDNTNATAGTVNTFYDNKPYNALTVINNNDFAGGEDSETDDQYRQRLLNLKQKNDFGSKEYYVGLGMEIDGVHDVLLLESETATGKIIVNADIKPVPNEILALVVAAYTDELNKVFKHTFEVEATTYTEADLEIECDVSQEIAESDIIKVLNDLFNGKTGAYNGLSINEPISRYMIMACLERDLPTLYQVTNLTSDSSAFIKLTPDTNTALKVGEVTITQNIVN